MDEILGIAEGLQWRPKRPETKAHDFVEDLIAYVRSIAGVLQEQNLELARVAYLTAFQHSSSRLTELLSSSKAISSINQCGFLNLNLDY